MIPIHMSLQDWQQVLNLLSQHPFNVVAPLIGQIQNQAQQSMAAQQSLSAGAQIRGNVGGNGIDLASGEDPDRLGSTSDVGVNRAKSALDS